MNHTKPTITEPIVTPYNRQRQRTFEPTDDMFASGCDIDEDGAMFPMDTTYIYVLFMGPPFVSRDMICRALDKRDFRMGNERVGEAGEDRFV